MAANKRPSPSNTGVGDTRPNLILTTDGVFGLSVKEEEMASLDDNGASYFASSVASTTTTLHSQEFHRVPVIDPQQQQQQERQGPRTDNDTVGVVGVPYITASTWLYCLGAALNSCNLGYDIGVSTGAGPLVQDDLNLTTFQREVFLGSMNFWSS